MSAPKLRIKETVDYKTGAEKWRFTVGLVEDGTWVSYGYMPSKNRRHTTAFNAGTDIYPDKELAILAAKQLANFLRDPKFRWGFEDFNTGVLLYTSVNKRIVQNVRQLALEKGHECKPIDGYNLGTIACSAWMRGPRDHK